MSNNGGRANSIMEQCRGNDASSVSNVAKADISPKSKQKKKSLCQMLMNKKTRVGCLETSYKDGDSNKNSKADNSQHESHTSTKLSLCCAMTERSRTPPQSLTASRLSPTTLSRTSVKSEVASVNGKCQTDVLVEKQEVYLAHGDRDAHETNINKKVIMREKEQRQSTYTEDESL
ncbi:hypothetical protein KPH14_011911 [Odynerus spinipes]|uniref:Uncharacterized protein n=1 Tax=Odynerus spinipes TaxID=1348599 RepID=A0AAD9RA69_9HYME|nr:hypothetical protein KPH14_011911 [Odynerus spinipes]